MIIRAAKHKMTTKEQVMKRLVDRRTILLAAGTAAAAFAGAVPAQSADIRGTVEFEGGMVVPKGDLEIYIDDPAVQDSDRQFAAETRVDSDGTSRTIEFSVSPLATPTASSSTQVVARLERPDGWLLARGSARFEIGSPVRIILYTVMY